MATPGLSGFCSYIGFSLYSRAIVFLYVRMAIAQKQYYDYVMKDKQTQGLHTARDWHVYHVFNDKDFAEEFGLYREVERPNWRALLAQRWNLLPGDVSYYEIGQILPLAAPKEKRIRTDFNYDTREYSFVFTLDTTKAELLEEWETFDTVRTVLTGVNFSGNQRRRPPQNTELLYATFKALKAGLKFKEIFDLYCDKELPGYKGVRSLNSADELRDFYNYNQPNLGTKLKH